jgi:hypothetical protein
VNHCQMQLSTARIQITIEIELLNSKIMKREKNCHKYLIECSDQLHMRANVS